MFNIRLFACLVQSLRSSACTGLYDRVSPIGLFVCLENLVVINFLSSISKESHYRRRCSLQQYVVRDE